MNIFSKIFGHHCRFNKPIISQYVSFHTRDIVYECKCGKRKLHREYFGFNEEFTIPTALFISDSDMKTVLEGKTNETIEWALNEVKEYTEKILNKC